MEMPQAEIPPHVPPELVRDVNVFNIQSIDPDIHVGLRKLQKDAPAMVYSPYFGGHWIPMRAHAI